MLYQVKGRNKLNQFSLRQPFFLLGCTSSKYVSSSCIQKNNSDPFGQFMGHALQQVLRYNLNREGNFLENWGIYLQV